MEKLVHLTSFSSDLWLYLAIDFAVAMLLLLALRWISGRFASVSSTEELSSHDNFAFGISVAGRMLALCIVMAGAVQASNQDGFLSSALNMLIFGIIGIVLIKVGRVAHDKIILHLLDKEHLIKNRNNSIALVDAASSIATALIIRSIMLWVEGSDGNAIVAILSGFVVTQAILLATTRLYERRFASRAERGAMQEALTEGQFAIAIQHAGHLLGTALVVTAAKNMLIYKPEAYVSNLTSWLFLGLALTALLSLLVAIAKRFVLSGLNLNVEIERQHNLGIASIELVLHVGIALILIGLFSVSH
jgi:uncharacterized membrane protein YjfL (UPF0719 family)